MSQKVGNRDLITNMAMSDSKFSQIIPKILRSPGSSPKNNKTVSLTASVKLDSVYHATQQLIQRTRRISLVATVEIPNELLDIIMMIGRRKEP